MEMVPQNRDDADNFIRAVARGNGWLSNDRRAELIQLGMQDVLESVEGSRQLASSVVEALSQNLYSKDTRFIYELIQNADDNIYSLAMHKNEPPSLTFTVCEDRIIVDSNEDGFTKANVQAICNVGKSTKSSIQGYIGEKGIGFKSVFTIANKVHIQSGTFSFAFCYEPGQPESGLGMVHPLVEPPGDLDGPKTRMILHLKPEKRNLFSDFEALPDNLLLFLQKLRNLTVRLEKNGDITLEKSYSLTTADRQAHVQIRNGGVVTSRHFWIARKVIKDMPSDETRVIEDKEKKERRPIKDAEVVLAFPVDQHDTPIIDDQHIFAFLPLKKFGFKFLIQSDFVTQANREDVANRPWNLRLLNEIVALFLDTTNDFMRHDKLKYQWIRYLSIENVPDEFWSQLQQKLMKKLQSVDNYIGSNGRFRLPKHLRFVSRNFRDDKQNPLLPDCDCNTHENIYISTEYAKDIDYPILLKLGATNLLPAEFVHRLSYDVGLDQGSLWKRSPIGTNWRAELATVLLKEMDRSSAVESQVDKIALVPIINTNRQWVPARGAAIFFPTCRGIDIPRDLPLSLVNPEHLRVPNVVRLFKRLGISECQPERIFPHIKSACKSSKWKPEAALEHLKFIYWNYDRLSQDEHRNPVMIATANNAKIWPHSNISWTYHVKPKNEEAYHATEQSGIVWLEEFLDLQSNPRIRKRGNPKELSPEINYIACKKPGKLLHVLKADWSPFSTDQAWLRAFKALDPDVPIMDSEVETPLSETYLPLPKLRAIVSRLKLERNFGFVKELEDMNDLDVIGWTFLRDLGVGIEENMCFWIHLLKNARKAKNIDVKVTAEIYANMQRFCTDESDRTELKGLFATQDADYIFFPKFWKRSNLCLWKAPEWYTFHPSISSQTEYSNLEYLFKNVLRVVPEPSVYDYISYLIHLKTQIFEQEQMQKIRKLYDMISSIAEESPQHTDGIKDKFEKKALIFDSRKNSWYKPSACIWALDKIQLPSKFSIGSDYSSLKPFFCDVLGIEAPKIETHIQGLKDLVSGSPTVPIVKEAFRNICLLNPTRDQLKELSDCACFPVQRPNGTLEWMDSKATFAIVDQNMYGKLFSGKINFLDFSLEDVHTLGILLRGDLQKQYISNLVDEKTRATNSVIDEELSEGFRKKAYAICRYIMHHQRLPIQRTALQIFQTLRNIDVYTTDSISKTLSIRQGRNDTVSVNSETYNLHLELVEETEEEKLRLYVPKNQNRFAMCVTTELPSRLLREFSASQNAAAGIVSILMSNQLPVIDYILESAGIIDIEGVTRPEEEDDSDSSTTSETIEVIDEQSSAVAFDQTVEHLQQQFLTQPLRRTDYSGRSTSFTASSGGRYSTPGTSELGNPDTQDLQNHLFERFLTAVVDGARSLHGVPMCDHFNVSNTAAALIAMHEVECAVASSREFNIGAAGELFVYEWLKGLQLPGFGLRNWQSNIRHRIRQHRDYQTIEHWDGDETSDIVYHDCESKFTALLIDHGYLSAANWTGSTPKYYIEVKATPSLLSTPFFISSKQYSRLNELELPPHRSAAEVYLVARVFKLGLVGMGLKLYVDPAKLKREQKLFFKADKYAVTPAIVDN